MKIPSDLIHAAFFFIDIVGLSDPTMSTDTQTAKIKALNKCIENCKTFSNESGQKLILPTGDGMVVGFVGGLTQPLDLAIELQKEIESYNSDKVDLDKVNARIGCHSGNVFQVEDILGNLNLWGPGIILARRVMDIGDGGHILVTSDMAESLMEISPKYKEILHPLHDYKIKHEQKILIYSAHGDGFGNEKLPSKGLVEQSIIHEYSKKIDGKLCFTDIHFDLRLSDLDHKTIHHKRTYYLVNNSDEPIFDVTIGITTTVERTFHELNVKVEDESGKELKISGIHVDQPFVTEFTVKLNRPVFKGDSGRLFLVKYAAETSSDYFENNFLVNSEKFNLSFSFPSNADISFPKLVLTRDEQKTLIGSNPNIKKGVYTQITWSIADGISKDDHIRLEW